jgi:Zn-dependent protease with chaperone function
VAAVRNINEQQARNAELFGTHPPLLKRIDKLDAMAYRIRPNLPQAPQTPN